jgi:hypothetical protein
MKMKRITLITLALLIALLACTLTPEEPTDTPTPEPADEDALATSVAATLTAISDGGDTPEVSEEPPPTETPTSTPEPQPLRIAYVDNDNLQLWTEGVGSVMLYTGEKVSSVRLSEDGQVAVFKTVNTNWIPQGLYRINTDGSGLTQLINAAEFVAMASDPNALAADLFRWDFIPGTHTIAFNTRLLFEGPGLLVQNEIMNLDTDTGMVTVFFTVAESSDFYYSPDGTQVALSDHNSISLVNAAGTNLRADVLTFPMVSTQSEFLLFPPPTWAPDSSFLRVAVPSEEPYGAAAYITIYHIPIDGSPATSMGAYTGRARLAFEGGDISPDMEKFVYHTQFGPPTDNLYQLHLVDLTGGTDTIYSTGPETFKGWAPDSEHFVYGFTGVPTLLGRIGFGPMALTDVPTVQSVSWINNTDFIFTTGSHAAWEIRLGSLGAASSLVAAPTADFIIMDFSN